MPVLKFWKFCEPQACVNCTCLKNWDYILKKHTIVVLMSIPAWIRTPPLKMPWFDITLSYPLIQTISSKKSAQFFMIDIGNSSEGLGYFQNSTFSHLYQRLPFYVPNWQCDQRGSFDFFLDMSLFLINLSSMNLFSFIHLKTSTVTTWG